MAFSTKQETIKFLRKVVSAPIIFYQYGISPFLPASCRFTPTCSEYAKQAIMKHGVLKGTKLAAKRIAKCHPWGDSGHDPVP